MAGSDGSGTDRGEVVRWRVMTTSLGPILSAVSEAGVCCLAFGEGEVELAARFPKATLCPAGGVLDALFASIREAVERPGPNAAAIPLDLKGTPFQRRVWEALRRIPPGKTRTYGELAAALGRPRASRAVGGANAANRIAVLIPCHRVVAADGSLGGYAYGTAIKAELLRRERGA